LRTFIEKISPVQIQTVAPQDGLKKNANRNMRKTVAMPTLRGFPALRLPGVSVTTAAAVIMQSAIPTAPARNKKRRPNLSTVQVALSVKIIPKVPLSALMSWMVSLSVKTD
jgi:hypothetical protein